MRNVVFAAVFVAAVATRGWAQAPLIQVTPVTPQTITPGTVSPSPGTLTIVGPTPIEILPISPPVLEQSPAPAAPVAPAAPRPARPATPTPPVAAPGAPAAPPPQQAPPAPAAPGTKPGPAPTRLIAPRNVRFDIAITDSGGPKPVTKVVSVTVADNNANGSIRNLARLSLDPNDMYPLNLDVRGVMGFDDGSVRASVNVEYQPFIPDAKIKPGVINASATAVFQDGRKTQILQSTDPLSERRTTVEVTATILK